MDKFYQENNVPSFFVTSMPTKYVALFSKNRWKDLESQFLEELYNLNGLTRISLLDIVLQIGLSALKTPFCESKTPAITFSSSSSSSSSDSSASSPSSSSDSLASSLFTPGETKDTEDKTAKLSSSETTSSTSSSASSSSSAVSASASHRHHFNQKCPTCAPLIRDLANHVPSVQRSHSRIICQISGEVMDEHNPPLVLPNGHAYSKKALTDMATQADGKVTCPRTHEKFSLSECTNVYIL